MTWPVLFHDAFSEELAELPEDVQDEILAHAKLLAQFGPMLKRPRADTLNGSKYANMKELRFEEAGGVWRVAFAFDTNRAAVLLTAGDKSGQRSEKRFYKQLIARADKRFGEHLSGLKKVKER